MFSDKIMWKIMFVKIVLNIFLVRKVVQIYRKVKNKTKYMEKSFFINSILFAVYYVSFNSRIGTVCVFVCLS